MATSNIDQQDTMATADDYSIGSMDDEEEELDDATMSLVEHLEELRQTYLQIVDRRRSWERL